MNLYPNNVQNVPGIDEWFDNNNVVLGAPNVARNGTTNIINVGTIVFQPGQLSAHPGQQGQYSIVRWTAPNSGSYNLATVFSGLNSSGPTSTDVHVLYNGSSIFNALVNGFGSPSEQSFSTSLSITTGDIIDFAVGFGNNGNFFSDTTGVSATLTSTTPNPEALEWFFLT